VTDEEIRMPPDGTGSGLSRLADLIRKMRKAPGREPSPKSLSDKPGEEPSAISVSDKPDKDKH